MSGTKKTVTKASTGKTRKSGSLLSSGAALKVKANAEKKKNNDVVSDSGEKGASLNEEEFLKGFDSAEEDETEGKTGSVAKKPILSIGQEKEDASEKPSKRDISSHNKHHDMCYVYLGRIPDSLGEKQIRGYFSQFGRVLRVRLAVNKKTGHSRHYAFIKFENAEVARIAAETTHNYLLDGKLLQCRVITSNADMISDEAAPFKFIPWASIAKFRCEKPKSEKQINRLIAKRAKRLELKKRKLEELGIVLAEEKVEKPEKTAAVAPGAKKQRKRVKKPAKK
ncbi:RNA-binding domain-containing protein [Schizosaccharomyces japonicus yFS275]|uniref:Ribosomal biogenesis protein Gar2 n=1 Tax=Schizosaccharomyces japonicus (strain yFS275 / FY16936) TaxID=402676 RepID=B6JX23_SCHJY|nr:RNA-binding domain-containing protein [Schizosaccharomyces japonicus yFS275]EEB05924.1 ribosomal biogenesis protein Gar2 [Schizosaccharomyces japonicus yFS275]